MILNTRIRIVAILFLACGLLVLPAAAWPAQVFAPYVDTGLWPEFSITGMAEETGVQYYTLAFITADGSGNPAWAGVYPLEDMHFSEQIDELRSQGGDVIISFGGAAGRELALVETDTIRLAEKYGSVIDAYDATRVDFDIEGSAVADDASVTRRNLAIKQLQAEHPDLLVAYCLPVLPSGLTNDGIALLVDARDAGVRVDLVNIMVMDYGDWAAPDPEGNMGAYAIEAAESLYDQLGAIYPEKSGAELWAMIGLTPMIGQNDIPSEVFTLDDAILLTDFVDEKGIGLIAMWSANRDYGGCGSTTWVSNTCSGIVQDDYAFSLIFNRIVSGESPAPTPEPTKTPAPVETPVPTTVPEPGETGDWDAATAYTAGDTVTYEGETYSARWWTMGNTPGIAYVWECLTCDGSEPIVEWNPEKVYLSGDQALYLGGTYRARWWTEGDLPGTAYVWELTAGTEPEPTPVPTPAPTPEPTPVAKPVNPATGDEWSPGTIYLADDLVSWEGDTYRARWWTKDETPGVATVWEIITEDAPSEWSLSRIYVKGDRAWYVETLFEARWWTMGDIPGDAAVWQQVTA